MIFPTLQHNSQIAPALSLLGIERTWRAFAYAMDIGTLLAYNDGDRPLGAIRRKEKSHGIEESSEETTQGQETLCDQNTVEDESASTRAYLARRPGHPSGSSGFEVEFEGAASRCRSRCLGRRYVCPFALDFRSRFRLRVIRAADGQGDHTTVFPPRSCRSRAFRCCSSGCRTLCVFCKGCGF